MQNKFDPELNEEIRRTFRNFNRKVKRNKTKTKGKGMLPLQVSVKKFKDKYSDKPKSEIKRQLKLYQSFGKRDALNKINQETRLSKWELDYIKANLNKTKKFYDEEIADLKSIVGEKPEYYMRQHTRLETLIGQRKELDKDLNNLTEGQIEGLRGYINYAERSDIIKRQGFRLYLAQLERTMKELGLYTDEEIEGLLSKFDVLTENEFTEMVRREDEIDDIYRLVYSPEGRGKYELLADFNDAITAVEAIIEKADSFIKKYHKVK